MITLIPIEQVSDAHGTLIVDAFNKFFILNGGEKNGTGDGWGNGRGRGYGNGDGYGYGKGGGGGDGRVTGRAAAAPDEVFEESGSNDD